MEGGGLGARRLDVLVSPLQTEVGLGSSQSLLTQASGVIFNVDVTSILCIYLTDAILNHFSEHFKQGSDLSRLSHFDLIMLLA